METKQILIGVIVVLYALGALFFRNTHPYRNPREPFEKKQVRRRIGTFLVAAATGLLGVGILVQFLISKG